jgi:hypothetical protein
MEPAREMQSFIIRPANVRIPLPINHPAQLYDHFVRYAQPEHRQAALLDDRQCSRGAWHVRKFKLRRPVASSTVRAKEHAKGMHHASHDRSSL